MTKKIVFGAAAVAFAAIVMAPSASAACGSPRNATTFAAAPYAYWLGDSSGTLTGQTWQLGAPGSWNTGNCNTVQAGAPGPGFLYFGGPGITLNLDLAACGVACPASGSTLVVLAQNKTATGTQFLLDTIVETPANAAANFNYQSQGNHNLVPLPRPRVTSSSRVATTLNLSVTIDSIAAGLVGPNAASAVTGFRLLTKSSATDPGRDAASYDAVPAATFAAPGGASATLPVALNCTNPQDQWLTTQIVFEGGQVLSDAVSAATRVRCDPALATPKTTPKVKTAPKVRVN